MLKGMIAAFAMFSRLPMPKVSLTEDDMRFCMPALPLVGAVLGLAEWCAGWVLGRLSVTGTARGMLLAAVPVVITGGIHLDGFCDVADANSAWGNREQRLKIMKDPHIGAFAMIRCIVAAGVYAAFISQLDAYFTAFCVTFALSRALAAIAALVVKPAKADGMMASEHGLADRRTGVVILVAAVAASAAVIWLVGGAAGGLCALVGVMCCIAGGIKGRRDFGGFTGDVAGWLLVNMELCMAGVLMVLEKL